MEAKIKSRLGDELYQACQDDDLDTVLEYLSSQQAANPSYTPPFPDMMYTAISKDNLPIVKYCLGNGAAVTDDTLKKLLICRAKNTYVYFLTSKLVDANHFIPWYGDILSNAATANDYEWTQLCLEHGADPNRNLVDEHKSILAAVGELASVEMAALLVDKGGARVKGSGAIVIAAEEGKLEMVQYLLEHGADVDEIGIEHPTDERYREDMGSALHRATNAGNGDVVDYLIKSGANANLRDLMGRTPMDLARERNDGKLQEILKEAGAEEG